MYATFAPMAQQPIRQPSKSECGLRSIRTWSLKVPGSLSTALHAMYFGSGVSLSTNCHLRPVGKPAPPRPRSPDAFTSSITSAGFMPSAFLRPSYAPCLTEKSSVKALGSRMYLVRIGSISVSSDNSELQTPNFKTAQGRECLWSLEFEVWSCPHHVSTLRWQPESAASPRACRSSTSFPHDSGLACSCHSSLFTITTVARSHAPRHSNSSSVNMPEGSVSPTPMPSFAESASVTRSAPLSAQDSVRQTCRTYVPTFSL